MLVITSPFRSAAQTPTAQASCPCALMDGSGHSALEEQIVDPLFKHPAKKKLPEQRGPLIVHEPAGFRDAKFRHSEFKWNWIRSKKRAAVTPSMTR